MDNEKQERIPIAFGGDLSPDTLATHRISSLPPSMYYIPSFLTSDEESHILSSLPSNRWTHLSRRRLQAHPSPLTASGTLLRSPLPPYLSQPILSRFSELGIFTSSPHKTANHCLVNEYEAGQGIMGHEDGPSYWPCTATVSLGGSVVLDIWTKPEGLDSEPQPEKRWRIFQEPRSLLITTDEVYGGTLHGIGEVSVDQDLSPETVANWDLLENTAALENSGGQNVRTTRTSLTYRDVVKVSDAGRKILGLGRK
ncbi:hypothetical protein K461DRAFT_228726 [Myriangium duriaei CBS 260.36]|uniref:Fe2OG dioxygenase domain-containing protein n=1 Tax=Myriangium duriaei CBS 260.36 TaxID=1168546 RepID=A0A9P4IYK3_9PEZI|nr:hypothetical protein K461DRAFT_228726 [Myriangium duriaei CBS 260.36]